MLNYFGNIRELEEQLREYRGPLIKAIKDTIGKKKFDIVEYYAGLLLIPEAFITLEQVLQSNQSNPDSGYFSMSDDGGCHCILCYNMNDLKRFTINDDGRIVHRNSKILRSTTGLNINSAGLRTYKEIIGTNMPAEILSYVHEFAHFINYCLQEVPLTAANVLVINELMSRGISISSPETMLDTLFSEQTEKSVREMIALSMSNFSVMEEANGHALEREIWKRLGINIEKERIYQKILSMDMYANMLGDNRNTHKVTNEAFDRYEKDQDMAWNWHTRLIPASDFRKKMYASFGDNLKIRRIPVTDFNRPD